MQYEVIAESDVGIAKDTNQDSILIKHAIYDHEEILMAIICDGMGGLAKGEVASASVIKKFEYWFTNELPSELEHIDLNVISRKWTLMLRMINSRIREYGQKTGERLGTTFTGTLFINNQFMIVHVGDTRVYHIGASAKQLTTDQTYVEREIHKGTLTPEQAKTDKRRNMLLQCVGASACIRPQVILGEVKPGSYLLCSDGFRHRITNEEILEACKPERISSRQDMEKQSRQLVSLVKKRGEKDNISVILIKTFDKKHSAEDYKAAIGWEILFFFISIVMLVCGIKCM